MSLLLASFASLALAHPQDPPPRVVSGRVVNLMGEGIPAAEVWCVHCREPEKRLTEAIADGEGFFRITNVPDRRIELRATGAGVSVGYGYPDRNTDDFGRDRLIVIATQDAATLRGQLLDRSGQPAANIEVFARPQHYRGGQRPRSAFTDTEGRFELTKVPLGPSRVRAWIPGDGLFEARCAVSGDADVRLVASKKQRTSMQIVIDGLPEHDPPAVDLTWWGPDITSFGGLWRPVVEAGKWSADGLPDERYTVRLEATGYLFTPSKIYTKAGEGPHQLTFRAEAVAEHSYRAHVVDPAGQPVPNCTFAIYSSPLEPLRVTSDSEGKIGFSARLSAAEQVRIKPISKQWIFDLPLTDELLAYQIRFRSVPFVTKLDPSGNLRLPVKRAASISGRALLPNGGPASLMFVKIDSYSEEDDYWATAAYCRTDSEGRYRLDNLHGDPEKLRVSVDNADGRGTTKTFTVAQSGQHVKVPTLKLSSPTTVRGVVNGTDGKPIAGLIVTMQLGHAANGPIEFAGGSVSTLTDRRGRFRFHGELAPFGQLELTPTAGGRKLEIETEPFEIKPGKAHDFEVMAH